MTENEMVDPKPLFPKASILTAAAGRAKSGGLGGTHMTAVVGMHMPPAHTAGGMHNMGGMPLGGGMPGGLGGMPGMSDPQP